MIKFFYICHKEQACNHLKDNEDDSMRRLENLVETEKLIYKINWVIRDTLLTPLIL